VFPTPCQHSTRASAASQRDRATPLLRPPLSPPTGFIVPRLQNCPQLRQTGNVRLRYNGCVTGLSSTIKANPLEPCTVGTDDVPCQTISHHHSHHKGVRAVCSKIVIIDPVISQRTGPDSVSRAGRPVSESLERAAMLLEGQVGARCEDTTRSLTPPHQDDLEEHFG